MLCFSDFLLRNRNEAIEMCIFEYNEEEALQYIRQDEREIGYREGEVVGYRGSLLAFLKILGTVSDSLQRKITAESDPEILKRWIETVAKVTSIEEFTRQL